VEGFGEEAEEGGDLGGSLVMYITLIAEKLTSSSANRISAQLFVNSHTSRNSVSAASANAASSSTVVILNLSTTSPPYFASNVSGSCALDGRLWLGVVCTFACPTAVEVDVDVSVFGCTPKMISIAVSRSHVSCGNTLCDL
jgi:hypothetical protein